MFLFTRTVSVKDNFQEDSFLFSVSPLSDIKIFVGRRSSGRICPEGDREEKK